MTTKRKFYQSYEHKVEKGKIIIFYITRLFLKSVKPLLQHLTLSLHLFSASFLTFSLLLLIFEFSSGGVIYKATISCILECLVSNLGWTSGNSLFPVFLGRATKKTQDIQVWVDRAKKLRVRVDCGFLQFLTVSSKSIATLYSQGSSLVVLLCLIFPYLICYWHSSAELLQICTK
jgi:hypothetical protein